MLVNRCHLSLREMRWVGYGAISRAIEAADEVDGMCLIEAFYLQSGLLVRYLVEETGERPRSLARLKLFLLGEQVTGFALSAAAGSSRTSSPTSADDGKSEERT